MFRQNFGKGIQYKFLKDISIILFISTCVLSAVIAINEGRMLKRSLMTKGSSFATYIAELSQDPLIMKDSIQLDSIVNEANKDEDIIYAVILDPQGTIITSQYASINYRSPRLKEILSGLPKDSDFKNVVSAINKKGASAEVSVRILSGDDHIGTVTISLSENNIRKQIIQTVLFVIALNLLVAFALGSVLFIASRKTILDPIIELSHAAVRLAKGDLSTQAKTASIGEIQMLVDSFNRMAGDLEKTTVSKDYVDNIINSMSDALMVISSDGSILLANHAACSLLGYECSELLGRPFDMVLVAQFPAEQMIAAILSGASVRNIEIKYVTKTGKPLPMLFSGSAMNSSGGKLLGIVCAATDISDRKKAEEALREANDRLNATLQASPAAIITLSLDGIVTMWNEAAEQILGWSKEEITGSFYPVAFDKDLEKFHLLWERVLRGESFFDVEVRQKRRDDTIVDISLSAAPLHDAGGKISGIMLVMSDITDRKNLEGELLRAQKLESIGILAGGIAHDFNNILASILGNINLVKLSLDPGHASYARIAMAEKASLRATDLTNQLLTFSRGGTPVKKTTSIGELLRESANFSLRGSNVKCECSLAEDLWPIEADEGQMSQVIHNLVINADQAMPEGGTIHIRAENTTLGGREGVPLKEGSYVKITIEDQGVGILEEQLKKIFDPYFTTKQKGSGLGLAIVYSIIKSHEGYVTVKSTVGAGTVFTIFLPASEKQVSPEKPAVEALFRGKGRILIMDDDAMLRETVGAMLQKIGYEVGFAQDGSEAVESYATAREEAQPFDAVIMDLTIPGGMGGREAIKKIKELDPSVKAIVSSGFSQDATMANYREYGFIAVISKPYRIAELSVLLHKVLNGPPPSHR